MAAEPTKPTAVAPVEAVDRFEQTVLDAAHQPRVDREAGIIRHVHVLGVASQHGYSYGIPAQKAVLSRFEQQPVGLDHDYASKPMTVAAAWGTLTNISVDDDGTWGDLSYLKSHDRTEQVLEDLERGLGIFSLSVVAGGVIEGRDKVITHFYPKRVDLVVRGATTKTLLEQADEPPAVVVPVVVTDVAPEVVAEAVEEAAEAAAEVLADAVTADAIAALRVELAELRSRVEAYESRVVLHEQFIEPRSGVQQTIEKTVAGLDLKAFWNDAPAK